MHLLLGVIHAPSDIPGWHGPPRHRLDRVPEASGALVLGAVPGSVCPFPALFRPPSWMLNRVTLPGVGILPSRTGTPALLLVSSAKRCLPCGQGHTVLTGVPSSSCCREIGQRGQESNQGCQGKADRWGGRGTVWGGAWLLPLDAPRGKAPHCRPWALSSVEGPRIPKRHREPSLGPQLPPSTPLPDTETHRSLGPPSWSAGRTAQPRSRLSHPAPLADVQAPGSSNCGRWRQPPKAGGRGQWSGE